MDVPLRLLSYFVVVAEELHFTRAAERLAVAQPALSKAVRRLENELDLVLFARNRQGVSLTDAGHSLLPVAHRILADFDGWLGSARASRDTAQQLLHVGYHSSIDPDLLAAITADFQRLRPDWRIDLRLGDWTDPAGRVLDGRVRAALLPLPVPGQDRLDTETIMRDRRCVALPAGHPLAARASLRLADLRGENFVALPAASGPLRDFWLATAEFGAPVAVSAEVVNSEDYFQAILAGHGVALITESSSRVYTRPGIEYRPVEDAPPSELAVAWPRDSRDPVLRDFVQACLSAAPPRRGAGRRPRRVAAGDAGFRPRARLPGASYG